MDGRESGQCPRYDLHGGVCGCPEFWQLADGLRDDCASSFGVTSDSSYGRLCALDSPVTSSVNSIPLERALQNKHTTSSVNSIPLAQRTRAPQITPAPPGPIKDTCFFWYHGTCRRGSNCDRPHEVHPTWPISPPPNFRHFQPCSLPLCPLRTDMPAVTNNQDNQWRGATTVGESSEDTSFKKNDADTTEALMPIPPTLKNQGASETLQRGVGNQVLFTCKVEEEAYGYKVEEQSEGSNELGELDYIDLSQLPSLPSTPPAQQEDISSISHIGTLAKRPLSPTKFHRGNDKRVKNEQRSSSDLSALHTCDTPDSSRVRALPLICFHYYHEGYCSSYRRQKCDYLHGTSTSQQTVSLPNGIVDHNPACALPLCSVRLRGLPELPTALTQPGIESGPDTLPQSRVSVFLDSPDPSLRDKVMAVRGRHLQETHGQSLPQLTGPARQRYEGQKHSIEDVQAKKDTDPADDASLHEQRTDKGGKNKRRWRGAKKSARKKKRLQMEKQEAIQRELKDASDALVKQRPLPLFASQAPDSASSLPTSTLAEEQNTNHRAADKERLSAVDSRHANYVSNKVLSSPLPEAAHQQPQGDQHVSRVDAVESRLPKGGQRLDCDTNLVRRFFDEFG